MSLAQSQLNAAIAARAQCIRGAPADYDGLLDMIGDARYVLLGEATHGTHEFYEERARITQRLIAEKGFTAVAVEADWPDAYRVNRYVRAEGDDHDAESALAGFQRFPSWMWRNADVVNFVDWLRSYNDRQAPAAKAGFYGLDLYSLFTSMSEVLRYLDQVDPDAAGEARQRYGCFDHYGDDSQQYAYAAGIGHSESCQHEVIAQLHELQQRAADYMRQDGIAASDAFFYAQQNARLVKNAEEYYRTMFRGRISSWNLRDQHMSDTLDALSVHLRETRGTPPRIVVWEHNSHVGDARATEIGRQGEWNVGELSRKRYGDDAFLVGFSTYDGWVTAASDWDGPAERKQVRPALDGSYEDVFHQTGIGNFMLPLRPAGAVREALSEQRLERAIGVLYLPRTERQSHYFTADLPQQFDAVIHFDRTDAVQPLETTSHWDTGEAPETFPVGL
ncbi:erythromycin esterase family protein [Massilia sp. R2A-15]|uniref:erythromycin esterase family protein n=1 Tax=Massilia sp. R2A-15 TaxID=3064278 RepID=UPI002736B3A1|nr:erythromycin esterase family protein [Massilia sp. R2A-15]WLI91584.1 erythromycin esterase family protein [Massilia sp. R2A-15]